MKGRTITAIILMLVAPAIPAMPDAPPTASSSDQVHAYFYAPFSRVTIVSPAMDIMTIEYAPPASHSHNAVARVDFAGAVTAWQADSPSSAVPATFFSVITDLVGTRADGTWTLVQAVGAHPLGRQPLPAGIQLSVQGKTWDDVMPDSPATSLGVASSSVPLFPSSGSEPIENGGSGRFAADLSTSVKFWNWHSQRGPRYDVDVIATQNGANPEQDPRLWRFHRGAEGYVPSAYASASDVVWAHLSPYSSAYVSAPDGQQIAIRYEPLHQSASCISSPTPGDCAAPAVVEIRLDGTVKSARLAFPPATAIPTDRFVIEGSLVGSPIDGTWKVDAAQNTMGLPAGIRLHVAGKIFDNVAEDTEPIEAGGSGSFAGGTAPYARVWNWHVQEVAEYHTHATSHTTAVETPVRFRFVGHQLQDAPSTPPIPRVDLLDATGGARFHVAGDGSVTVFIDRNGNGQHDPDEIGASSPPAEDIVSEPQKVILEAFPEGRLESRGFKTTALPDVFVFETAYIGMLPPRQIFLVTEGAYYGLIDAATYPLGYGGATHHRMYPDDTDWTDGTLYQVTLRLKPGTHMFHFQATDPLLRWMGTGWEVGPHV